jgi:5-methylcytosine-specific restriction endonuclease McrA
VCDTTEDLTVDHILAKAAGGTDHRDNLTTMCRAHNSSKGHRR